jgi:hypothetical protein
MNLMAGCYRRRVRSLCYNVRGFFAAAPPWEEWLGWRWVEAGATTLFNGGRCEVVNCFGHQRSCSIFASWMKRDEEWGVVWVSSLEGVFLPRFDPFWFWISKWSKVGDSLRLSPTEVLTHYSIFVLPREMSCLSSHRHSNRCFCWWPNLVWLKKSDCSVCQFGVSDFGSFRAKPRNELNLKIWRSKMFWSKKMD